MAANNESQFNFSIESGFGSFVCTGYDSPLASLSPRSLSPLNGWTIQYKINPKSKSNGVWDGYQTREEFLGMHLR